MQKRFWQIILTVIAAAMLASSPALADSLTVYVGYADSLRPSGFFPTPWLGGANVVSQSSPSQTFDSGAIRIDNTGANSIVISNFKVYFPSNNSTFAIWNSLTIGPGQTGIFTQTTFTNFDTSDFGAFGSSPPSNLEPNNADSNGNTNLIGGCSSPASFMTASQLTTCNSTVPVISFDENGNLVSFSDTGHILDTGEWDFVNNSAFGEDGNESINWNTIGGSSRGGNSTPEPGGVLLFGTGLLGFAVLYRRCLSKA
jgi:hypothetical protein